MPWLGTVTAWVLVRDEFRGKGVLNAVIDLPFALPTIVAGLLLLDVYGPGCPVGVHLASTRNGLLVALLFVTLPFVVRAVQPVLQRARPARWRRRPPRSARPFTIFRRIVLPNILPGILSGMTMAFARAVGEIGAIVMIPGTCRTGPRWHRSSSSTRSRTATRRGAAAVAVVLLVDLLRRPACRRRHPALGDEARACRRARSSGRRVRLPGGRSCSRRSSIVFWRTFAHDGSAPPGRADGPADGPRVQAHADRGRDRRAAQHGLRRSSAASRSSAGASRGKGL